MVIINQKKKKVLAICISIVIHLNIITVLQKHVFLISIAHLVSHVQMAIIEKVSMEIVD
jgi:hypothetical protein